MHYRKLTKQHPPTGVLGASSLQPVKPKNVQIWPRNSGSGSRLAACRSVRPLSCSRPSVGRRRRRALAASTATCRSSPPARTSPQQPGRARLCCPPPRAASACYFRLAFRRGGGTARPVARGRRARWAADRPADPAAPGRDSAGAPGHRGRAARRHPARPRRGELAVGAGRLRGGALLGASGAIASSGRVRSPGARLSRAPAAHHFRGLLRVRPRAASHGCPRR